MLQRPPKRVKNSGLEQKSQICKSSRQIIKFSDSAALENSSFLPRCVTITKCQFSACDDLRMVHSLYF